MANTTTTPTTGTTYRRPASDKARENRNAYMRRYRKAHPDKTRAWRQNYIKRAAARLAAADPTRPAAEGGAGE